MHYLITLSKRCKYSMKTKPMRLVLLNFSSITENEKFHPLSFYISQRRQTRTTVSRIQYRLHIYIKCLAHQKKKTEVCNEQGSCLISIHKNNTISLEVDPEYQLSYNSLDLRWKKTQQQLLISLKYFRKAKCIKVKQNVKISTI